MKIKISILTLFLVFAFSAASAQQIPSKVTKTQIQQQKRIKQGVKSGELTKKEAKELQGQQLRILKAKRRAQADGKVTHREKAKVRALQRNANRNITIQKNDRQARRN